MSTFDDDTFDDDDEDRDADCRSCRDGLAYDGEDYCEECLQALAEDEMDRRADR